MIAWVLPEDGLYPFPLLIFLARVADVSLGTIRLIFVSRGYRYLAPLIGFVEILIWVLDIGQIMKNLSNAIIPRYKIKDVVQVEEGIFPQKRLSPFGPWMPLFRPFRKGK